MCFKFKEEEEEILYIYQSQMHNKIYRKKKKMEVFIMTLVHYYHYPARLKFRFSQKNYLNQSRIFFFILVHVPSMSILWEEYGKETKNSLFCI